MEKFKIKKILLINLCILELIIFTQKIKSIINKTTFLEEDSSQILCLISLLFILVAIEFYIYLDSYFKNKQK